MSATAARIARNTGYLYAKMGVTMFISLYTTRLLLNALGAAEFGIFNLVGGTIAMLGFLNGAMASATQRFMSFAEGEGNQEKQQKIFNISFILHIGIAIVMCIVMLIAGYFFFNGVLNVAPERIFAAKVVYGCLVIGTIFTVLSVPYDAMLNAHENMLFYSIVGVVESLLKLGVALAVVYYTSGDQLILYGVLMAAIPIITVTIMQIYCHKNYPECDLVPKRHCDRVLMKEMMNFAALSFIGVATGMISQYGLSIVLNNFFGTILNAAQGIANQLSGQLMVFSNTMMKAINPVVAKSEGGGHRERMLQVTLVGSKFSFFLLAFFAMPFIIEAPYILNFWLKSVPEWAVLFTRLQLIRSLLEQCTVMLGGAISAQGDIKAYTFTRSMLNISPILFTFLFFHFGFPPYYLYISWIVAGGLLAGWLSVYYTKEKCGLMYNYYIQKVLFPSLGISILLVSLGSIPACLMSASFFRLLIVCFVTTSTFLLSTNYLFLSKQEKAWIGVFITSLKSKLKIQIA